MEHERTTAARAAGLIWIASTLMLVAAQSMRVTTSSVPVDAYAFRGADVILGLPSATIGLLIIRRRHRNPIGWLWLAAGVLGGGLTNVLAEYSILSHTRHGGSLPLTDLATFLQQPMWVPAMGCLFVSAHLFPTGALVSRRWRAAAALTILGSLAFTAPMALYPGEVGQLTGDVQNPYALSEDAADALLSIFSILFLGGIVSAIASVVVRYRRARGVERAQIRWLIPALTLVLAAMVANMATALASVENVVAGRLVPILTIIPLVLLLAAAGNAILRYRLYDIEIILNRTVIVGVLVAFITIIYVAIVAGIGAAVGSRTGSNVALPIVATAIVGVAFQPVWIRARRIADRMVYGKRATPEEALAGFADVTSVDTFTERLPRLVVDATTVRSATFWRRTGDELTAVSSCPASGEHRVPVTISGDDLPPLPDTSVVYPLEHHGELLGVLGVGVAPNESLSRDDDRLIRAMAAQASHVLRALLDAVPLPTGIVTFLMTDIEGSTRLWEESPVEMAEALSRHDHLIRAKVAEHRGVLVKARGEGDSTFSVFADPPAAIAAALAIQTEIAARTWPTPRPICVRASLHTGSAHLRDRDYYGPVINRCARLRAIAAGGQTLASGATYELTRDALPGGARFADLGTHKLKDLVDEERVYQLNDPRLPSEFPPLRTSPQTVETV